MIRFEYKVIPAPSKGRKAPGIKGAEARFAHGLEEVMNEMAGEGWEYQRSDILPSEERQGLTSSHTVYRSVLVFRRTVERETLLATEAAPEPAPAPKTAPEPETTPEPEPETDAPEPKSEASEPEEATPENPRPPS